jgi:hypothetical protein
MCVVDCLTILILSISTHSGRKQADDVHLTRAITSSFICLGCVAVLTLPAAAARIPSCPAGSFDYIFDHYTQLEENGTVPYDVSQEGRLARNMGSILSQKEPSDETGTIQSTGASVSRYPRVRSSSVTGPVGPASDRRAPPGQREPRTPSTRRRRGRLRHPRT